MMTLSFIKTVDVATIDTPFTLDSGDSFLSGPVSYEAYGTLNSKKDNLFFMVLLVILMELLTTQAIRLAGGNL